jgi:hypothetical protein
MQLGTRWSVGGEPPSRLSPEMQDAIRSIEAERGGVVESGVIEGSVVEGGVDTSLWRWTLTWLEGHPVAELEDGTVVREEHDGSVVVTLEDSDF